VTLPGIDVEMLNAASVAFPQSAYTDVVVVGVVD